MTIAIHKPESEKGVRALVKVLATAEYEDVNAALAFAEALELSSKGLSRTFSSNKKARGGITAKNVFHEKVLEMLDARNPEEQRRAMKSLENEVKCFKANLTRTLAVARKAYQFSTPIEPNEGCVRCGK